MKKRDNIRREEKRKKKESIERLKNSPYFTSNSNIFNEIEFELLRETNPRSSADEKKYQKYIAGKKFIDEVIVTLEKNQSEKEYSDYVRFEAYMQKLISKIEGYSPSRLTGISMILSEMDKTADIQKNKKGEIVVDPTTKDTEIIKLTQNPDKYFEEEVYPHVPDAIWAYEYDPSKKENSSNREKLGAEIPFTKYFYEYQAPETVENLEKEFMDIELSLKDKISALFEEV